MYNTYNSQVNLDRINNQIAELEKIKAQLNQPAPITQNFQLAPTREIIRYANSIEEVRREPIIGETPYFSKDMSVVWVKNQKGEIKTYELTEIVPKDEKDMQIELLQTQISELRKEMRKYDEHFANANEPEDTTDTKWSDEADGEPVKENKPTGVQRVSRSKTK